MRVVFLDMDGVVVIRGQVEQSKVYFLNDIWRRTGAEFVLSSAWRHWPGLAETSKMLRTVGFMGDFAGQTGTIPGPRGYEILEWLQKHDGVKDYVVLDDDGDAGTGLPASRFVQTDNPIGLTPACVERVVEVLGG